MKKKLLILLSFLTPVLLVLFFSLHPVKKVEADIGHASSSIKCYYESRWCDEGSTWESFCVEGGNTGASCPCGIYWPCGRY